MTRARARKRGSFSPMVIALYAWTVLFILAPLVYILYLSFMTRAEVWGYIPRFTFSNYVKMLDPIYANVLGNSLRVAVATTLLTLLIGYPFAYITARLSVALRDFVLLLLMAPFWLNSLVRMYGVAALLRSDGVINTALSALGVIDAPLKLLFNNGAVLAGMVYGLIPMMIFALYNSLEKLNISLLEAARDLGAGPVRTFFTVTVPQTLPGIFAGCVLVFVPSVGLFFISDLLGGAKTMLIGNLIKNELLTAHNWPFGAALSVAMLIVTLSIVAIYKKLAGSHSLEGFL